VRKHTWILGCGLALAVQLSGCGSMTGKGLDPGPAGATRLAKDLDADTRGDYPVDLAKLIALSAYKERRAEKQAAQAGKVSSDKGEPKAEQRAEQKAEQMEEDDARAEASLDLARAQFYAACHTNDRCSTQRDRVQDRLIWASESACNDYLVSVRKSFTATNLNLGSATTLFGALGSVITAVDTARVFSGAAAVTSGLRAEYNDVYFSSQAFELVSKAIRSVRERTLKNIRDARQSRSIRDYTLEGAIGDAMRYHATCNVMAGLEEAADAVTRERDPGLKHISELLQGVGAGANVSLGTAALDLSNLPSAQLSCTRLTSITKEGAAEADKLAQADAALQLDANAAPATKAASAQSRKKVDALKADLQKMDANAKPDCDGSNTAVVKAETAMFDRMREFAGLPLADKAQGKAKFDAARANVLTLKVKLDAAAAEARLKVDEIAAIDKTP
jgi:hypothetical protein